MGMGTIKVGDILIAKSACLMQRPDEHLDLKIEYALIIGKEYEVKALATANHILKSNSLVISDELYDSHFFSLAEDDEAYWGNFFNKKPDERSNIYIGK